MLRGVAVLVAVAFLGIGASARVRYSAREVAPQTQKALAPADLRGVWTVAELASRAPGAGWEVRPTPSLSQYIFTEKHYSYMYVPGAAPRKRFAGDPNAPTDAEKAEAYSSLVAATGTYSLSGHTLTLTARIHKNPNEMAGEPLTYAVEINGTTLRMTITNPPFLPGREWRTVLTRVE
jgi:hypothetical protein